jgi:hypothetical protein
MYLYLKLKLKKESKRKKRRRFSCLILKFPKFPLLNPCRQRVRPVPSAARGTIPHPSSTLADIR